MIVHEARPALVAVAALAVGVHAGVGGAAAVLAWGLLVLLGWLFREPRHEHGEAHPLNLLSPADGVVAGAGPATDPYRKQPALAVVVRVGWRGPYRLRCPIEGQVVEQWGGWRDPQGGRARSGGAVCLRTDEGDEVVLAFSARLPLLRRVHAAVGDRIGHGHALSLLPFGGRTAVLFAGHGRVLVAPGQPVIAGRDSVAQLLHD